MLTVGLVKAKAKEQGFDLVGITSAEPMKELVEILKNCQQEGKESVFVTSDIKKRTEPKEYFPEGKTVLMVALNYYLSASGYKGGANKFARFVWGKDYHRVMEEKLNKLGDELTLIEPKLKFKIFVDTSPLVERELARLAGLGFIGKNASLINPEYGSWIILGGMIFNWDLETDSPIKMDCGDCELCIRACPAKAIEKPYQINPHLCLSYITQKKGCLTQDEYELMGNKIYGCDTCQEVCPINRRNAKNTERKEFTAKKHLDLSTEEILKLNKKEFENLFGETAVFWRGNNIIKRNALIALVNKNNPKTKSSLIEFLKASSPLLRGQAALILGNINDGEVEKALRIALQNEKDPQVSQQIQLALKKLRH